MREVADRARSGSGAHRIRTGVDHRCLNDVLETPECTSSASPSEATRTSTVSPSNTEPARIARASRSSISCCMSRRSGRAP